MEKNHNQDNEHEDKIFYGTSNNRLFKRKKIIWRNWLIGGVVVVLLLLGLAYGALHWSTHYVLRSLTEEPDQTDMVYFDRDYLKEDSSESFDSKEAINGNEPVVERSSTNDVDVLEKKVDVVEPETSSERSDEQNMKHKDENNDELKDEQKDEQQDEQHDEYKDEKHVVQHQHDVHKNEQNDDSDQSITDQESSNEDENFIYSAHVSVDKAKKVEETMTLSEQLKVVNILVKRLTTNDIQQIANLMQDGLNVDEKRQAKHIILERLSEEEYNDLIQIAVKYGLSQGKSYQESLEEVKE